MIDKLGLQNKENVWMNDARGAAHDASAKLILASEVFAKQTVTRGGYNGKAYA